MKIVHCENCANNKEGECSKHPDIVGNGNYCSDGISEQKNILVRSPSIARNLLKKGFKIVDIKPNKSDKKRTVFIFENKEGLVDEMKGEK